MAKWLIFSCGLVLLLFLQIYGVVLDSPDWESSPLHELSDKNFEHDTQASTGQTTGRWLILFTGPDCETCDAVEHELSITAAASEGGFVAAKVNASASPVTSKRFNVSVPESLPHIILFRDRTMYVFPKRSDEILSSDFDKFVNGGYMKVDAVDVPAEPGLIDELLGKAVAEFMKIYSAVVEALGTNRVLLVGVGGFVALSCYFLVSNFMKSKSSAKRPGLRGGVRRKGPSRRPKTS